VLRYSFRQFGVPTTLTRVRGSSRAFHVGSETLRQSRTQQGPKLDFKCDLGPGFVISRPHSLGYCSLKAPATTTGELEPPYAYSPLEYAAGTLSYMRPNTRISKSAPFLHPTPLLRARNQKPLLFISLCDAHYSRGILYMTSLAIENRFPAPRASRDRPTTPAGHNRHANGENHIETHG
jgi:hypothetical protein